jgi:hypothetical protein
MRQLFLVAVLIAVVAGATIVETAPATASASDCSLSGAVGPSRDYSLGNTTVSNSDLSVSCNVPWFARVTLQRFSGGNWTQGTIHDKWTAYGLLCGNGTSGSDNIYACPSSGGSSTFFSAGFPQGLQGPEWQWTGINYGSNGIRDYFSFISASTGREICHAVVNGDDSISSNTC